MPNMSQELIALSFIFSTDLDFLGHYGHNSPLKLVIELKKKYE